MKLTFSPLSPVSPLSPYREKKTQNKERDTAKLGFNWNVQNIILLIMKWGSTGRPGTNSVVLPSTPSDGPGGPGGPRNPASPCKEIAMKRHR